MGRLLRHSFLALVLTLCHGDALAEEKVVRESIEWSDIWVAHADNDALPRVLLVGDSIARGYYESAEKALEGKASCARYSTSAFIGHSKFLAELEILLEDYRFDVIHINNGLHGWGYTEEEYAQSFPKLFETLQKHGRGAAIIWASTTPVRSGEGLNAFDEKTERVKERNRIAAEIIRAHQIPVDDLFALVEPHADFYAGDGVHFNEQGRAAQGKQVAEIVSKYLPRTNAAK